MSSTRGLDVQRTLTELGGVPPLGLASRDSIPAPEVFALAKSAGSALAAVKRATIVDTIVMASAALRGDVVYTSDLDDLSVLQRHFPSVRVLVV